MRSWFSNELAAAMADYACHPDALLSDNATQAMLAALDDFTGAAFEVSTLIASVANRTDGAGEGEAQDEADLEAVDRFNELLGSLARLFMFEEGLPRRTWHKNILWNTPLEDWPSNGGIWYALHIEEQRGASVTRPRPRARARARIGRRAWRQRLFALKSTGLYPPLVFLCATNHNLRNCSCV